MAAIELGKMFLGGAIDPVSGKKTGSDIIYDARNLTTHGIIVGMTGSGKTGLGIVMLEEALTSKIPCLILDPKGDMGNLLLNFPSFSPGDFLPWVNEAEAKSNDISLDQLAAQTSASWRSGLEGWGIGPDRMQKLADSAGFAIYTPGSASGIPINVVGSLVAPKLDWSVSSQAEIGRDEIEGLVSSLLVLARIDADPISSPEHILLANIIEKAWSEGRDLDLGTLISQVRHPPMRKLGIFEIDSFYPQKERDRLAIRLNGLIASPSFAAWLQGPPLDIESMLFSSRGQPQASIVYLAHLSDAERQFVVTLILSKLITWMRRQSGTPDLRALVYMDEVFGFAPPTAEPPSKKQILTILKQGRAYGVGMVLSTQNPVDLDYKAMSNAGTWMIGRLQTERDKARILVGMESVSGQMDMKLFDRLISSLDKRQFILQSARAKEPQVFTSRWSMSYLAGPLDRNQIERLSRNHPLRSISQPPPSGGTAFGAASAAAASPQGQETGGRDNTREVYAKAAGEVSRDESRVAPQVDPSVSVYYLDPAAPWASQVRSLPGGRRLQAGLIARVHLTYDDNKAEIDYDEEWEAVFFPLSDRFDPATAIHVDYDDRDLARQPPDQAVYVLPRADLNKAAYFKEAKSSLRDHLARNLKMSIFRNAALDLFSRVGESKDDFERRCQKAAEDRADAEMAKLTEKHEASINRAKAQLNNADRRVRELDTDTRQRQQEELIGSAGDLLTGLLGGRRRSVSLGRVASRRSMTVRTQERLRSAEEKKAEKETELEELEDRLAEEISAISDRWKTAAGQIEKIEIPLEKADVDVDEVSVLWIPVG